MARSTKAVVARRIQQVYDIVLNGGEFKDIAEFAEEEGWGLQETQLHDYHSKALEQLELDLSDKREQILNKCRVRRNYLWHMAKRKGNLNVMARLIEDEQELVGAYPTDENAMMVRRELEELRELILEKARQQGLVVDMGLADGDAHHGVDGKGLVTVEASQNGHVGDAHRAMVIKRLTKRDECNHGCWAWRCWCPTCAENVLAEYDRDPMWIPGPVRDEVSRAIVEVADDGVNGSVLPVQGDAEQVSAPLVAGPAVGNAPNPGEPLEVAGQETREVADGGDLRDLGRGAPDAGEVKS